ncbi:hypothetical protein ASG17_13825 [Brevundimonas sp. Leaf363]|uniref:hypothetical protein n=1 Tax=Brevundimonas sp. Leaf363 TaxID=1736353 RepID=UPI0006F63021|nr:hypothetical protein [Brevundimonas sp. Leaf363]KQS54023.1 hypothetical protein ASG17_13825 [Brevundimonas sp. Leaf363]
MLVLLLVAALQGGAPQTPPPGAGDRGATPSEEAERRHPRGRQEAPAPARPVDDRFAVDPNAPPRPTRRVTVPNPHDPEPATSNPH